MLSSFNLGQCVRSEAALESLGSMEFLQLMQLHTVQLSHSESALLQLPEILLEVFVSLVDGVL